MSTHWHGTTSVPGPVDPDGCCADQPPTTASILAGLRAEVDRAAAERLAKGIAGERSCFCELGYECLGCGRRRIARRNESSGE